MNVAFWDHTNRRLVEHERVPLCDDCVTMTSLQLSMLWQSDRRWRRSLPSPYWLAWGEDDPTAEDLRLFFLNGPPDLSESDMDTIRAAAARLARAH